jgi:protease-4
MGKKLWLVLILVLVLVFGAILVGTGLIYLLSQPQSLKRGSVIEVTIPSVLNELPAQDPISEIFAGSSTNLWELRQVFESAASDDRISAVYLEIYPQFSAWAQIEELREQIASFRNSGKKVYVFLAVDIASEKELYLSTASDYVALNPTSGLLINGLMAEVVFMKRTMDKLGVRPQFIQLKEYKSAETYSRQELTPAVRGMLESILKELQERFVATIAKDRNILEVNLSQLMDQGLVNGQTALEENLVDELAYRQQVREKIRTECDQDRYNAVSAEDYLEASTGYSFSGEAHVAVVGAVGTIVSGRSESFAGLIGASTVTGQLRRLRENKSIDGVILRVDSPGGSAVGSDMVWREIGLLEEAGKPVVVTMSGVAASGGYYISMGASSIVSQPSTITGSIGVIFGKFDISGLYEWLGMDVEQIKLAPNADLFSQYSSLTPEQEEQVKAWVTEVYDTFVQKASKGRQMDYSEMEPKAQGRIYTGAQAMENGLVDQLGGMEVAINEMKTALGLESGAEISLELYPKPKTLWESLASGDLLELSRTGDLVERIRQELLNLETPGAWLIAPEIKIK